MQGFHTRGRRMRHRRRAATLRCGALVLALAIGGGQAKTDVFDAPMMKGKAYVSAASSGYVSVLDLETLTVVKTISAIEGGLGEVRGAALDPTGAFLYVASRFQNSVHVISTVTDEVVETIALTGSEPYNVVVSPDGARVYVACKSSGDVAVIDTVARAETLLIDVGSSPEGIAISPDGSRVFVTNKTSDSVTVIDTATNATVGSEIPVASEPRAAAVTDDGSAVVVVGNGGLDIIDTATLTSVYVDRVDGTYGSLRDVDVVGDTAYVTDFGGFLDVFDIKKAELVERIALAHGRKAYGVAVDPDSMIALVTDESNDTIRMVDLETGFAPGFETWTGWGSRAVAFLPAGNAAPANTIRSFLLPKTVKLDGPRGSRPARLRVKSFFDTGPNPVNLTSAATLTIGESVIEIPGLTARANGRSFEYKVEGVRLTIKPSAVGSSRATLSLDVSGDVPAALARDGELDLRFKGAGFDAAGAVKLAGGKFTFGRTHGTLLSPEIDIRKAKASLAGIGRHGFKVVAGLPNEGPAPASASDVTIAFGSIYHATVPAADFVHKGNKFIFKGNASGITNVVLDYDQERIAIRGKEIDLGTVPIGPTKLLLIVTIGADTRAVEVRAVHNGKLLKY